MNPFAPLETEARPSSAPAIRAGMGLGFLSSLLLIILATPLNATTPALCSMPASLTMGVLLAVAAIHLPRFGMAILGAITPLLTALLSGFLAGLLDLDFLWWQDNTDGLLPLRPESLLERLGCGIRVGITGFFLFSPLLVPMGVGAALWIWKIARRNQS